MIDYTVLTADRFSEIMWNVASAGVFIGFLLGIFLVVLFAYGMQHSHMHNLKMYLCGLKEDDRRDVLARFEAVKLEVDELSNKTNLRMFKSMYNRLSEVKAYLERKWMQN
jgi:hypothetical protein